MISGAGTTRRTILRSAPGLAALPVIAGCSLDLDPTPDDPTLTPDLDGATGSAGADGSSSPEDDAAADIALVTQVRQALSAAYGEVAATRRSQPRLAATFQPLERLHRAHAGELGGLGSPRRGTARVGARESTRVARRRVERMEGSLEDTLVAASVSAASGPLAATLASMAGAVAQARATL